MALTGKPRSRIVNSVNLRCLFGSDATRFETKVESGSEQIMQINFLVDVGSPVSSSLSLII